MSVASAQQFIGDIRHNDELRRGLNGCSSQSELQQCLKSVGHEFSLAELEQAYTMALTNCQSRSLALELREILLWYQLLYSAIAPAAV